MSLNTANLHRKAMSLIEVMLAVLILAIALVGVSSSFVSGRRFVVDQQYYQEASQLISQKFEHLKAIGYDAITLDEEQEELEIDEHTYVRKTEIELTRDPSAEIPKPCKKVTVTIDWSLQGKNKHRVKLSTYIGP